MATRQNGERVSLGAILSSLITAAIIAGAVATAGVTVLVYRANANDTKVEALDARQRVIETTQAVLVREMEWTSTKLDALLASLGVDVPSPPPLRKVVND